MQIHSVIEFFNFVWRIDFQKFRVNILESSSQNAAQSSKNNKKCWNLVFNPRSSKARIWFQDNSKCQISSPTASNDSLQQIRSQDDFSIWALFRSRNRNFRCIFGFLPNSVNIQEKCFFFDCDRWCPQIVSLCPNNITIPTNESRTLALG